MAYKIPISKPKEQTPQIRNGRVFKINDRIEIVCKVENARDGFRHRATLFIDGQEKESTTTHYINRTWESYEFQSVMQKLVDKSAYLSEAEKDITRKWLQGDRTDWSSFKTTAMVMKMGEVIGKDEKEKNDWKVRMLKAGLGNQGLEMPDDWDTLSEKEKSTRLDKIHKLISETGKRGENEN